MKDTGGTVRKATEADIDQFMSMIMRMKKLNGEFDSLFRVREGDMESIKEYYLRCIKDQENFITLLAVKKDKIMGLLKAEIRERISYEPSREVRIIDLYIMPEFRRKNVGNLLLGGIYEEMKKRGISIITAEFPSLNLIALNFYEKIGYRQVTSVYGKNILDDSPD
ncbi:MAG: GNAT family N-acetyltransferase [Candidatus Thermoplasmatota archaeon]|jgi:ribosomal protein S18 acetylase RimI-like enzyme|nr:GNAT family N-acetyltransferase [Candidatus Thermoplasmatota archaeon]MCL5987956.1 GNAT family N-acetyltransferase [Candidatus Thermoplasmatota archaeon]